MATIYVVATPIGNLKDITLRALDALKESELIICEDTRVTAVLLNEYGIKADLFALNEFNEEQEVPQLITKIGGLSTVSLVSDAGTPLLSDPGFRLIRALKKTDHTLIPIPGPSAVLAALVVSGMPTDKFTFLGFLPKSQGKQTALLTHYQKTNHTLIFFESPHRIVKTLVALHKIFGDIPISLARELTKKFEENTLLPISHHLETYQTKKPKGEFTIVLNPSLTSN